MGTAVGTSVGASVGTTVGTSVGTGVGASVGANVVRPSEDMAGTRVAPAASSLAWRSSLSAWLSSSMYSPEM